MKNIKCLEIIGNKLSFRDATEADAEFILSLRTDEKKSRFLTETDEDIAKQRIWLQKYATDNSQAYFIIYDSTNSKIGTVRLYDIQGDSFCWGSWILADSAPSYAAIESALIVYKYAISLGFSRAHFDVRKGNSSVYKFHERFGAKRVLEDQKNFFYEIDKSAIEASLIKYSKYLPAGIVVKA